MNIKILPFFPQLSSPQVVDVSVVAAMAAPGAGRPDLPRRLKRRFAVFAVPAPAPADAAAVLAALLGGHFAAPAFPRGLAAAAVSAAVPATLALAERAARRLLPTPARFHYSFTLRELAAVAQGMALADTGSFSKDGHERELAALWAHEARRVFSDRLVGDDERAWVDAQVRELLSAHFGAAGAAAAAAPSSPISPRAVLGARRGSASGEACLGAKATAGRAQSRQLLDKCPCADTWTQEELSPPPRRVLPVLPWTESNKSTSNMSIPSHTLDRVRSHIVGRGGHVRRPCARRARRAGRAPRPRADSGAAALAEEAATSATETNHHRRVAYGRNRLMNTWEETLRARAGGECEREQKLQEEGAAEGDVCHFRTTKPQCPGPLALTNILQ